MYCAKLSDICDACVSPLHMISQWLQVPFQHGIHHHVPHNFQKHHTGKRQAVSKETRDVPVGRCEEEYTVLYSVLIGASSVAPLHTWSTARGANNKLRLATKWLRYYWPEQQLH
ncbi:hypothetical protein TraAM80_05164 [Trypanosoma rangeli]|uniref:Uncharacterized protein n=1 Tax=Trypanosoma rangeli TaxID=5698 RepID=A0A422NG83_TRYRA|nr:uncharacterized protein TraAM80_05164 [Trypanosoma rangeli]RNF04449.1 hypothetical protein TraAM80_05164 [Trypanosoma rangeli]|eukprot:RNF04449.1 hypothetical protein TraAM80_05164 [Trypanosoma rangeli]